MKIKRKNVLAMALGIGMGMASTISKADNIKEISTKSNKINIELSVIR